MDASVALNPAPGRTTLSKAIALGLPGEGAMLVAMLLAGCTGAPRPTRWPGPSPLPLPQHSPEPRRGRRLNRSPLSWGSLASCSNASRGRCWRRPLGFRQRKPVPKPNVAAWLLTAGIALASPCSYSPPQTEGEGLDAGGETGAAWSGQTSGRRVSLRQRRWSLSLAMGMIGSFRCTGE